MTPDMKEWIEKLEDQSYIASPAKHDDGDIYEPHGNIVEYYPAHAKTIILKGNFTIEQLEALIEHMKKYEVVE